MKRLIFILVLLVGQMFATAGQTYPTGTVFQENFGNTTTNPEACWSGGVGDAAKCKQLWTVDAGSGQSIATAPIGWTGKALLLPANATALRLATYGTFPLLPAATDFTFTITVDVTSYPVWGASEPVVYLLSPGEQVEAQIRATQDFRGREYDGFRFGNLTICAAAANTVHTLKLVRTAGNYTGFIDNVQCGDAWVSPGNAVDRIWVLGGTVGDTYIQSLNLDGASVTGGWPPSVLIDFAGGSGTVDAAKLAGGTHCGNASGAWSAESVTGGVTFNFAAGGQAFSSPWPICGTNYPGTANVVYRMDVPGDVATSGDWARTFYTKYKDVSMGAYVKVTITGGGFTPGVACDILRIDNLRGISYNLQIQSNADGSELSFCGENVAGGGDASNACVGPVAQNTWVWVGFNVAHDGANYVWAYTTGGSEIGTIAFDGTPQSFTDGQVAIGLGKGGSSTTGRAASVYYSNVTMSYADAPLPLLPPFANGISPFWFSVP